MNNQLNAALSTVTHTQNLKKQYDLRKANLNSPNSGNVSPPTFGNEGESSGQTSATGLQRHNRNATAAQSKLSADDEINSARSGHNAKEMYLGSYKLGSKTYKTVSFVYIPSQLLLKPSCSFDEVFSALDLKIPPIIFRLNQARDPSQWNMRLPENRKDLKESDVVGGHQGGVAPPEEDVPSTHSHQRRSSNAGLMKHSHSVTSMPSSHVGASSMAKGTINSFAHGAVEVTKYVAATIQEHGKEHMTNSVSDEDRRKMLYHYHGVLRENCRRLLRGTRNACMQASVMFRIEPLWNKKYCHDLIAEWITNSSPPGLVLLGLASRESFTPEFRAIINRHQNHLALSNLKEIKKKGETEGSLAPTPELIPDKIIYEYLEDNHDSLQNSMRLEQKNGYLPHPHVTHMIISDRLDLLEMKLSSVVPSGVILVNGGIEAVKCGVDAVQSGQPLIAFKYTGGAADMMCDMLDKKDHFIQGKMGKKMKNSQGNGEDTNWPASMPFHPDMSLGNNNTAPFWQKPFDREEIECCNRINILVENFPDRFNPQSVFIVDMFSTTEDDVQDQITKTMAVVFEAEYELGGLESERKRLSYAWRIRAKFIFNAGIFKILSDALMLLIICFTMGATVSAVLYSYFSLNPKPFPRTPPGNPYDYEWCLAFLANANLLLPLIATVIRGIYSAVNPYNKYAALKNASVMIETEIFMYRGKVGKYGNQRVSDQKKDEGEDGGNGEKESEEKKKKTAAMLNPRKIFSNALDQIWIELGASDLSNGSLITPFEVDSISDINEKIAANKSEQNAFLVPMEAKLTKEKEKEKKGENQGSGMVGDEEKGGDGHSGGQEKKSSWYSDLFGTMRNSAGSVTDLVSYSAGNVTNLLGDVLGLNEKLQDDGISPITPDQYIKVRLVPMAVHFSKKAPGLSNWLHMVTTLGVVLSVASSALAAFGYSVFVPAALAVSGSFTAFLSYQQTELRLMQTNAAYNQLNQLFSWWEGLTMIEKRVPGNKDTLIKGAEMIILSQATIFSGGGGSKRDDNDGSKDNDNDDDDKNDK